jgi:hypothetical protein
MRFYPERLLYSFSIQLVVMHLKKNQLMMLYWFILFGFITQSFSKRFGIPYLFLDPEYLGEVNILSFFIVGITCGVFIMAFNVSSYILNSFRFPFLACLSKTFQKYTFNNFIIPASFVLVYIIEIVYFQYVSQFKSIPEIMTYIIGFLAGIFIIISLTLRYFLLTNKDIYKLFGVEHADIKPTPESKPLTRDDWKKRKAKGDKSWRVETYLVMPFHTRLVRGTEHYKTYMLQSVFKQNHINAAVMEVLLFTLFIILGLFREFAFFQIPAAASLILLFTMFIMLSGVFRFWLKSWASTAIIGLFILINFFSQFEFFNQRNKAFGLNYSSPRTAYNIQAVEENLKPEYYISDREVTIQSLENWKKKWTQAGIEKPKLVVATTSGGGLRSSLFTFRTLQIADSVLDGKIMDHLRLISGSSGGIIGAAYYRGLYLNNSQDLYFNGPQHVDNISKDLLNTTTFSFTVSDLFMNVQTFRENGSTYYKDRGYAFETELNKNTGQILSKPLGYYRKPELNADIPMMIVSPTIINDGRALMISPLGISYLLQQKPDDVSSLNPIPDGIEFTRFFSDHDPLNTRFSSILRMNSNFPYIMPATSLPTDPWIEVMDAGIRDNYGVLNAVRFIYEFRDWIKSNTSGVVFLQIRDTNKKGSNIGTGSSDLISKLTSPLRNVSGNFILMQDYIQDDHLRYLESILDCPFDYVSMELPQMDEKIALSWHLTEREKQFLINAVYTDENRNSMDKLGKLLNYPSASPPLAIQNKN